MISLVHINMNFWRPFENPVKCSPQVLSLSFKEDAPSQWEVEETVRFKDLYDQDKDGKLNREEQLRWIAPNSYGAAQEEVRLDLNVKFCIASICLMTECSFLILVTIRLFTSLKRWTRMETGRSQRPKSCETKIFSWIVKWQTTADICTCHMMNYNFRNQHFVIWPQFQSEFVFTSRRTRLLRNFLN